MRSNKWWKQMKAIYFYKIPWMTAFLFLFSHSFTIHNQWYFDVGEVGGFFQFNLILIVVSCVFVFVSIPYSERHSFFEQTVCRFTNSLTTSLCLSILRKRNFKHITYVRIWVRKIDKKNMPSMLPYVKLSDPDWCTVILGVFCPGKNKMMETLLTLKTSILILYPREM